HAAVTDEVAAGGPAVARHDHAVGEPHRHACRRVRYDVIADVDRTHPEADSAQQLREVGAGVVARREERHRHGGYWPPFCTYDLTKSSAFVSNTPSISSSRSSSSAFNFSPDAAVAGASSTVSSVRLGAGFCF